MEVINSSPVSTMGYCSTYCDIVGHLGCATLCAASLLIGAFIFDASYTQVSLAIGRAHG